MPYQIRKCKCKDSKGKKGKYIVTKKGKKKHLSCHTSKAKAAAAIRARYIREDHRMVAEKLFWKLLYESTKNKKSLSGSHPEESYELGWPKYDEEWFDKKGITTWDEDREWTKQYFKDIGLL